MAPATAGNAAGFEPVVDTPNAGVPVLVNSSIIEKGQELIVHWPATVQKAKPKSKSTTWFDESERLAKKRSVAPTTVGG